MIPFELVSMASNHHSSVFYRLLNHFRQHLFGKDWKALLISVCFPKINVLCWYWNIKKKIIYLLCFLGIHSREKESVFSSSISPNKKNYVFCFSYYHDKKQISFLEQTNEQQKNICYVLRLSVLFIQNNKTFVLPLSCYVQNRNRI